MATTEKYTHAQIDSFYHWHINDDTTRDMLLEWIIQLLPQSDFDDMMQDCIEVDHSIDTRFNTIFGNEC